MDPRVRLVLLHQSGLEHRSDLLVRYRLLDLLAPCRLVDQSVRLARLHLLAPCRLLARSALYLLVAQRVRLALYLPYLRFLRML